MSYAGDISPQQAWDLLAENPDAVLVDVRTDAEWKYRRCARYLLDRPADRTDRMGRATDGRAQRQLRGPAEGGRHHAAERPGVFLCRSGQRSVGAAEAATAAGIGPSYNVLDGFEGALDEDGHRGAVGWRALGLPWRQS